MRKSPGIDPAVRERELMMGMKMPPARAVVEGMAGASRASAAASPYASPKVLFPNHFTKMVATRRPRPVFSNPCMAADRVLRSHIAKLLTCTEGKKGPFMCMDLICITWEA